MHLPSEWHQQAFVQLTWPHAETDWAPLLAEAVECYVEMAREISRREPLLIVANEANEVETTLLQNGFTSEQMERIRIVSCPTNDTWARDHAFITCLDERRPVLLDFQFNGWGEKFEATLDNQINQRLYRAGVVEGKYEDHLDFVLEGGSIESDGEGTVLTTSSCLLAPHRNQPLTARDIEQELIRRFGAKRVLWLHHGYLAGDDTDGHIDTLARLCPDDTIAYVQCTDPTDEHFAELQAMEQELKALTTLEGKPYRLIPLPMPRPIYDPDASHQRLPATYANFLIMNGAVLYPTYAQPDLDLVARRQLQLAFPDRDIVGIDCQVLIRQHGSLHCCTMQYPR